MEQGHQETPYSQGRLLNALLKHFGMRFDIQLACRLDIARSNLCRIRKGRSPIGAALLVRIHEESGISIKELRKILGDRRKKFRGRSQSD